MRFGAWIHERDLSLGKQILLASQMGLQTIRSYSIDYAIRAAPALQETGMSLMGGMHINSETLAKNWHSQLGYDDLNQYHELGVSLEGICVGNELRQGGDDPASKRFTARLSFGLVNVLDTYRCFLDDHGITTPLTYAMEGIVFDEFGNFYEWLWPLIDACDIVSVNLYPMGGDEWFTFGAFEESRRFLTNRRVRSDRLALYEIQLRRILQQLQAMDKPLILSETGFPSAIGYRLEGQELVIPENDNELFAEAMGEYIDIIRTVNQEYSEAIQAIYFYEWRDNLYHSKIWNLEQSPIHTAFGLFDRFGNPKFDLKQLIDDEFLLES